MTTLPQRLESFGKQYEWPYKYITDNNRTPADQQKEAQATLLNEFGHSILEDVLAVVGEDEDEYPSGRSFKDGHATRCNKLRARIRAALTAYCIGEGEKLSDKS